MGRGLTSWLKDKDQDVWYDTANHLNWDNSLHTLKWIVTRPECDKANVANIFWAADPAFFACKIAAGEGVPAWSESWPLVETILQKWRSGFYQQSELAWPDDSGRASLHHYQKAVSQVAGADKALDIPPELFGPFAGRLPHVPPELTPYENAELWDMLSRQGTWCGHRPGSDEWKAAREKPAQAASKPGFWSRLFR